jgi:hypothetical protein
LACWRAVVVWWKPRASEYYLSEYSQADGRWLFICEYLCPEMMICLYLEVLSFFSCLEARFFPLPVNKETNRIRLAEILAFTMTGIDSLTFA